MKTDARVRYTKMRIREAFLQCLRDKPVNRITVKELCDLAEINRATFYTHYKDPFDLLEQLEEETMEKVRQMIAVREEPGGGNLLPALLRGMKNTSGSLDLLASSNGDPAFAGKVSALFYESYLPRVAKNIPDCTPEEQDAVFRFLAGGCGNLITDWLRRGMDTPPEELADLMGRLSAALLKHLERRPVAGPEKTAEGSIWKA